VEIRTIIHHEESVAAGFVSGPVNPELPNGSSNVEATQISFTNEIIRKSIHLCSLSIPIVYYYVHRETALMLLVPIALFSIAIDMGRHFIPAIQRLVAIFFDRILRPHERQHGLLSGASYVLISAVICVLIFPKLITVTAFSILIVSDGSSALFGRAFGKHRFLDKSLEGTLAFIISAWVVVFMAPKAGPVPIEYVIGALGAIVGGIAEAASVTLRMDDNFSVPLSIGFTMWGLYWLAGVVDPAHFESVYRSLLAIS